MCGIWGWWHLDGKHAVEEAVIRQATDVMHVRGPDDFGFYRSPASFAMGFRRLSIIDLQTGHQPMSNEDGTIQVTLNGEIYNFRALKRRLLGLGHQFKSDSDTEVIAHGYEEWGDEVLGHLCGMFGLAIWDERRRRLLLARDRMGIKPVYYVDSAGAFGYASDPRALVCMLGVDQGIDEEAVALYLYYANVPAPWTIYKGIRKLRPAEKCVVEAGRACVSRYWNLSFDPQKRSARACLDQFEELFEEVVGEHLIADVPLGAFLSGGMDSTCVVQAATKNADRPIMTFNVAFSDPNANEEHWANEAAEVLGTVHHRLAMNEDPQDSITETLAAFPEPFGDTAATPNRLVSKLIREHCTVALSGDGGDEVFGGYGLRTAQVLTHLRRFPKALRELASSIPGIGPLAAKSLQDLPAYYAACRARLSVPQIERIMNADCKAHLAIEAHIEMMRDDLRNSNARGPINPSLFLDQSFGLADQMLTKVDVTSMAHSLEVRVPMLDHRIVEFAAALPEEMKQKGFRANNTKLIIRHYLKRRFHGTFINRPKMGFGIPMTRVLCDRIKTVTPSEVSDSDNAWPTGVQPKAMDLLLESPELSSNGVWALYALTVWHRCVENTKTVPPATPDRYTSA